MTEQERPDQERNEDVPGTPPTAVVEPEQAEVDATTDAPVAEIPATEPATGTFASLFDAARDAVASAVDAARDAVAPAIEAAKDAVMPAVEAAKDAIAPATEAVQATAAPAVEAVKEAAAPVVEATQEAVAPVVDAVTPAVEAAQDAVAHVAEAVTPAVEAAQDAVAPVAEAAQDAVAPVAEAAKDAVAPAAAAAGITSAAEASYVPPADEGDSGKPRRIKDLVVGQELTGRVTSIALYGVFVDIGVGRDGLVHISEMSDTRIDSPSDLVKIGDSVNVRVKAVEPDGRRISLTMRSKERGGEQRNRGRKKPELNRDALAALRVGDNVSGTITGMSNFGVFVDIGVGKDGLVHVSELAEGRIEKPEDIVSVGQTHTFKILEVDAEGARISLSLRRAQRGQRLQQLENGAIVEGTVSGIAPFGAFVDIGVGRDGLVHISEMSEGRIAKVEDAVTVGQKVQVRVLEVDTGNKRISLSMLLEPRAVQPQEERVHDDRYDRVRQENRPARGPRQDRNAPREPEVFSLPEQPEETFTGDATIEDLLSKYGSNRKDRRRRTDDDEEDTEDRTNRRQRDAIRRTIQHMGDDE